MARPKIGFIGTGGTIASVGSSSLDLVEYVEVGQMLNIESLIEQVPLLGNICEPKPYSLVTVDSIAIEPGHWLSLQKAVSHLLKDDIAGVVVTHGTATLEETAYFLDLVVDDERPIVLTGAMRPISGMSSDGHLNLLNAARIASAVSSKGIGTLVSLSGAIHAARYAIKQNSYSVEAFGAAIGSAIGEVIGPDVRYFYRPARAPRMELAAPLPRVDIVMSYAGSDGFAIQAAVAQRAHAIVVAGFPPGYASTGELKALERARSMGVQIIQASRAMGGQVLTRSDLKRNGFIAAGRLTPQKARILAMVAISSGLRDEELQQAFEVAA